MGCSGPYANYDDYKILTCRACSDESDKGAVQMYLRLSAGKIHSALAAQNACSCTLAPWAADYLKELNVLAMVAFHNCPCSGYSQEERNAAAVYVTEQLELLRTGAIAVCAGDTGIDYPAFSVGQYSITDRNAVQIIWNRIQRRGN